MSHRMILNETSYHGSGSVKEVVPEIKKRRLEKVLIVTDKGVVDSGILSKVTSLFDENNIEYVTYDGVKANPTIQIVSEGLNLYQLENCDGIVAVGGGSPQDSAKAIAIIATNPEFADVRSLEGVADTKNKCAPLICIATTCGTAAEVTINYVITDENAKRKFVCVDVHDIPIVAIVDPDLMQSMPSSLIAATGMDAMTHAIESYITPGAWDLSKTLDSRAITLIAENIESAVKKEAKAIESMALAQYIAGMAFSNVGLGVVHSMAHPLSAFYDTPHGIACATLLPFGLEFNQENSGELYREIGLYMGLDVADIPIEEARSMLIAEIRRLNSSIGVPLNIKELGSSMEDFDILSDQAINDACTPGNPRPCTKELIYDLYVKAYNY